MHIKSCSDEKNAFFIQGDKSLRIRCGDDLSPDRLLRSRHIPHRKFVGKKGEERSKKSYSTQTCHTRNGEKDYIGMRPTKVGAFEEKRLQHVINAKGFILNNIIKMTNLRKDCQKCVN